MTSFAVSNLKSIRDVGVPGIHFDLVRLPGTERVIFGSSDFRLHEIDFSQDKPQAIEFSQKDHGSYITGVVHAGPWIITGGYNGQLKWWDLESREPVREVAAHERWIRRLALSPDGQTLASVADDMTCALWDAGSGELKARFADHAPTTPHHYPSMLYAVAFSADGRWLATGDKVGHVVVRDIQAGKKLAELDAPVMYTWDPRQRRHSIGGIRSLAFSPDGRMLAVGGIGKIGNIDHLGGPSRVEVFDWAQGERLHELSDEKLKGLVERILFYPDGSWFLAAGGDHSGFLTCYETATGKILHQQKWSAHVHSVVADEAFSRLYVAGHERLSAWELEFDVPAPVAAPPVG